MLLNLKNRLGTQALADAGRFLFAPRVFVHSSILKANPICRVPGCRKVSSLGCPPVLAADDAYNKLKAYINALEGHDVNAFYSSTLGGIVTDPGAMVVHESDRGLQMGCSVFDTANVEHGGVYGLDAHLDRFMDSMSKAKIVPPLSRSEIKQVILYTAAVGAKKAGNDSRGIIRFWASAGVAGSNSSAGPAPTVPFPAALYVKVSSLGISEERHRTIRPGSSKGVRAITTTVGLKSREMATMKTTNYLANELAGVDACERGGDIAVWLEDGLVQESHWSALAFVTASDELVTPVPHRILSGRTVLRAMELARELKEQGLLKHISLRSVTVAEARASKEMMSLAAGFIRPVVSWDAEPVGDGKVGPVAKALDALLVLDREGKGQGNLERFICGQTAFGEGETSIQGNPSLAQAARWDPLPTV